MTSRHKATQRRPRALATAKAAAVRYDVDERTIRNWISQGLITGYRLPTGRAIRVDLDEIEERLEVIPTVARRVPAPPRPRTIVELSEDEAQQ